MSKTEKGNEIKGDNMLYFTRIRPLIFALPAIFSFA